MLLLDYTALETFHKNGEHQGKSQAYLVSATKQAIKPWKNMLVENLFLNVHFLYAQYGITNNILIKK